MSKTSFPLCFLTLLLVACNSSTTRGIQETDYQWTNLIDPSLSNWDTYLSFKHQIGYDGTPPKDAKGNLIEPIGLNIPGYNVFTTALEKEQRNGFHVKTP